MCQQAPVIPALWGWLFLSCDMGLNMLTNKIIETTVLEIARKDGIELNDQEKLVLRTQVALRTSAKRQYKAAMASESFVWKRPLIPRR